MRTIIGTRRLCLVPIIVRIPGMKHYVIICRIANFRYNSRTKFLMWRIDK
jgi:hypothetical protein